MKVRKILVFVGIVITGFSGAANASDYTVWYQAGTYIYHIYLNGSVGHDYDSTGYVDNWISMNVLIHSVSNNDGMQHVTIDVGVMGYSNATQLREPSGLVENAPI